MGLRVRCRSLLLVCSGTVVLGGSCFVVSNLAAVRLIAQGDMQVTPFVLLKDGYSYETDQSGSLHMKFITARRSDGARTEFTSVGPLSESLFMRSVSLTDGTQIDLVDPIEAKTTWPAISEQESARRRTRMLRPPLDCASPAEKVLAEHATVLDHNVVVVTWTVPHRVRFTEWKAPDLGCTALQTRSELAQPDGTYKLSAEERPVSLRLVEPDPGWFQTGDSYAEVKPSEMTARIYEWLGLPDPNPCPQCRASQDASYEKRGAAHH